MAQTKKKNEKDNRISSGCCPTDNWVGTSTAWHHAVMAANGNAEAIGIQFAGKLTEPKDTHPEYTKPD